MWLHQTDRYSYSLLKFLRHGTADIKDLISRFGAQIVELDMELTYDIYSGHDVMSMSGKNII